MVHMLERVPAGGLTTRIARARIANADDQDLGAHRPETMCLFEVVLEGVHKLFLDVQHASANLADRMVVVAGGELIVSGSFAEMRGINRP